MTALCIFSVSYLSRETINQSSYDFVRISTGGYIVWQFERVKNIL